MLGDCRAFQYQKDLRLKYLKERKNSLKGILIFQGNRKNLRHGQWHVINKILIAWYKKSANANVFPEGPMFAASNGQLEKFKQTYGTHETRITGKADNTPKMTIKSWIEHLPELSSGYELKNIWSMDKLSLFFKALLEKGLF